MKPANLLPSTPIVRQTVIQYHHATLWAKVLSVKLARLLAMLVAILVLPNVVPAQYLYADLSATASAQPLHLGGSLRIPSSQVPTEPTLTIAGGQGPFMSPPMTMATVQLIELRDLAGQDQVMKAVSEQAKLLSSSYIVLSMTDKAGQDLRQQYDVRTFPTVLVLSDNGQELTRLIGQPTVAELQWAVTTVTQHGMSMPELKKAYYAQMLNADGLFTYLQLLDLAGEPAADISLYYLGVLAPTRWTTPEAWQIIRERVFDWHCEPILYLMHNHQAFRKLYGDAAIDGKINAVCLMALFNASKRGLPAQTYQELRAELLETGYVGMPQIVALADLQRHKLLGMWPEYAKAARYYFKRYPSQDPDELDTEARSVWLHIHQINDGRAAQWALGLATTAVDLAPTNPRLLETQALLQARVGNITKAWATATKAIELANTQNISLQDAPRLVERLKAQ